MLLTETQPVRMLLLGCSATIATVDYLIPVSFPFFSPAKWPQANRAYFSW